MFSIVPGHHRRLAQFHARAAGRHRPNPSRILRSLDIAVIAIYFAMVIWIGFYLKGRANTSEEFFMAGREMTAWIAGLSFVSRQPGLAGTDGLGRLGLPVRHPRRALVLDRRHPRHAVPRHGDDALLLRLQDPLRARLSEAALRQGASVVSAVSFAFMTS